MSWGTQAPQQTTETKTAEPKMQFDENYYRNLFDNNRVNTIQHRMAFVGHENTLKTGLALSLLEVPNRYLAGVGEVALKNLFSDKTNWRKMLQNDHDQIDWTTARQQAINALPEELKPYVQSETHPTELHFPVNQYPQKVNSLNLSKTPSYQGVLKGIKGQYLIFGDQTVFNVRSNEGYRVRLTLQ